jgi:uncharacterized protein YfaS (alpha-2-macroglobulin family)
MGSNPTSEVNNDTIKVEIFRIDFQSFQDISESYSGSFQFPKIQAFPENPSNKSLDFEV